MMRSETPAIVERLSEALLDYVTDRGNSTQQSGGLLLSRAYTDDSGMFEIVELSVEYIESSEFLSNARDAMFMALKGCWAVLIDDKYVDMPEHSVVSVPAHVPFRVSPAGLEAKAILVINGAR